MWVCGCQIKAQGFVYINSNLTCMLRPTHTEQKRCHYVNCLWTYWRERERYSDFCFYRFHFRFCFNSLWVDT